MSTRPLIAFAMGAVLLLAGCATSDTATPEQTAATSSPQTSEPVEEKRIALEDLRGALISEADLPGSGWTLAENAVTIGQSDGRQWQPAECGDRFTTLFDETLAPPNDDFVTVTFERADTDALRIVTENIARWDQDIDIAAIDDDFTSLIQECGVLTSDPLALTLSPITIDDAAAIRIAYGAGALSFNLDIAYAQVGTYLVGVTNTGIATTDTELVDLLAKATSALTTTIETAEAIPAGVTPA